MKKLLILIALSFLLIGCGKKENEEIETPVIEKQKEINIVNINSKTRPYAVVINNTPVAVKVQTGLQESYMVYNIPVEGNMTRLLAFYKDIDELKVGTIRSARHNFLDFAYEQDAILVHFGWSHYAQSDIKKLGYNNINGLSDAGFYRENKENLATEHTAYTNISNMITVANNKNYKMTTDIGLVLNYSIEEIDLGIDRMDAKNIFIPSSNTLNTSYVYDEENKVYNRVVNGKKHIDYETNNC